MAIIKIKDRTLCPRYEDGGGSVTCGAGFFFPFEIPGRFESKSCCFCKATKTGLLLDHPAGPRFEAGVQINTQKKVN